MIGDAVIGGLVPGLGPLEAWRDEGRTPGSSTATITAAMARIATTTNPARLRAVPLADPSTRMGPSVRPPTAGRG
jgi:hypothetical protein